MKAFGNLLITVGFLAGAWVATQSADSMNWNMYVPMFVVSALGVFFARRGARQVARAAETLTTNIQTNLVSPRTPTS
jgi:hypothetical protein